MALTTLIALLFIVPVLCKRPDRALIPAYIWPGDSAWDTLISTVKASRLASKNAYFIVNPNNGVLRTAPDYDKALWRTLATERLKNVGRVICYVNLCNLVPPFPTCGDPQLQGARPAAETLGYVDDYIQAFGSENITGFFLDDTPMDGTNLANIMEIIQGIKIRQPHFQVITNPGVAATNDELLAAVTTTVYDEGLMPDSVPSPKIFRGGPEGYKPLKFAMILNNVPSELWKTYIETARREYYGYFYATSASYADLPPYLFSMLRRIAK